MENILLGVEPMRFGLRRSRADARRSRRRALARARARRHPARRARSARCRSPRSSSSRSRARSPSAAACSSSTSRRAASAATTCERLFALLAPAEGAGPRDRLHLALHRGGEGDRRSLHRAARRPERGRRRDRRTPRTTRSSALMVGGASATSFRARRGTPGEADPRGRRRSSRASATFTLHRGEILGIAGLIGSGRTRLLRTLFGLEPVRSGTRAHRRVHGGRRATPHERWRRAWACSARIARAKGSRSASSIADNLTHDAARAVRAGPARLSRRASDAAASRWIERLAIKCAGPAQPAGELSGGNQQKIAHRAAAPPRRRRPRARRADARHRRRQQGADLPARSTSSSPDGHGAARRRPC